MKIKRNKAVHDTLLLEVAFYSVEGGIPVVHSRIVKSSENSEHRRFRRSSLQGIVGLKYGWWSCDGSDVTFVRRNTGLSRAKYTFPFVPRCLPSLDQRK